jgi:uncharacterized protein YdaU (DUF1376 family)
MNYYPFHIGDYASATRHLSWDEDAAYRRLLDIYYTTERPLPAEMRAIFRLALASTDEHREAIETVVNEFFELTDEGWVNSRADVEIAAMRNKQQKQRDKANKRWHKPDVEHGIASALPQHVDCDAVASKNDADAMPPTPTPTPTPTPKEEIEKTTQRATRSQAVACPVGVDPQVWADWLQLRKAKKAPVTQSALDRIEREAVHAGMSLQDALAHSCMRGWAGFKAEWMQSAAQTQYAKQPRRSIHDERADTIRALTGRDRQQIGEIIDIGPDTAGVDWSPF